MFYSALSRNHSRYDSCGAFAFKRASKGNLAIELLKLRFETEKRNTLKQNQIFKNRIVSTGRPDVRLGAESVGVESSGRLVESGGGSPAELRTGAKHQGDERNEFDDGRHWRLSEKTFAGFSTRRPSAANSALLYDVRTFRRRSRDRLRRSASRYAIIQPRLCPHSACCRSDIYRKLSSYWVSKKNSLLIVILSI